MADAPADADLVLCPVDPPGAAVAAPREAEGIRGVRVRIVHPKELADRALDAASRLKGGGAITKLTAPKKLYVANRGKVQYQRDAASARAIADALRDLGRFEVERLDVAESDFDVVVWLLPAEIA